MQKRMAKFAKSIIIIGLIAPFMSSSFAATAITPAESKSIGSIQPGVISNELKPRSPTPTPVGASLTGPEEKKANPLGEEAAKIKFKLNKIILEGNNVYSDEQLQQIYQDKLHTTITVAQLQDIVQNITNYYRNNGYILSRAIIPPQHVANGVVHIRIIEGYIDQVYVIGTPKGARRRVLAYGQNIADARPAQIKVMEHYLIIENELPGVSVKGVLEPSKTQVGASDLNLATETKIFSGYFSYDNYGTRYIGPQELTTSAALNSIFISGDTTRVTYVTVPRGNEMQYKDVYYDTPVGNDGWRFALDGNRATTNPLYQLAELKIAGNAVNYSGFFRYPWIRTRSSSLNVQAGFNFLDSITTQFDSTLYADHIREVDVSGNYDFADKYSGTNSIWAEVDEGIPVLGGTTNPQSFFTSRYGATTVYTKFMAQVNRTQKLTGPFSLYGLLKGQYSFQPLLVSEQFAYGGSLLGRGYDPAEITGDRGAAGSLELRLDTYPQIFKIQTIEYYLFYDAGVTWNLRNVASISTKQDATSAGIGARFYMTKYLFGNVMFTQPLTRKVQSLELIGNGRLPRTFFSITAAV